MIRNLTKQTPDTTISTHNYSKLQKKSLKNVFLGPLEKKPPKMHVILCGITVVPLITINPTFMGFYIILRATLQN